jgi:hypothetical protein
MTQQDDMVTQLRPELPARVERRLSPGFALKISLGLHALFVLVLFRLYSEYASEPQPELHLVVRASASRPAATPSFVTTHVAVADATDESIRPSASVDPLPRRSPSLVATTITSRRSTQMGLRRSTLPATLPSTLPVVSPVVTESADESPPPAGDAAATPSSRVTWERTEVLPDMPLRVAMRPVYDRREQRPLGLAMLSAASTDQPNRQPADAFTHRFIAKRTSPENRTAIDRGLEFLARIQKDDGRWRFDDLRASASTFPRPTSLRSDAAATGLALLAFLGAGHDHFDGRYHAVIQDGLDFLLRVQLLDGNFFVDDGAPTGRISSFYSHGIATLALAEAYGMTGDARLRPAAQRALDALAARLESESLTASDWAVFGWQLATLRSGRLAGLHVDPYSLARIADRLATSQSNATTVDATSAAVGLAVGLHLSRAKNGDSFRPAAEKLLTHSPESSKRLLERERAAGEGLNRDSYYSYFGSQAMYYLGGNDWRTWAAQLYPRLIQSQVDAGEWAGSWEPPALSKDNADAASRLYVTAMNLLSLETEQRQPARY